MPDLEHARLMLRLGQDDLAAMEVLETLPRISPSIFGFHAQQAVEKALKAWLSLLDVTYPRIHLLYELFNLLEDHGAATAGGFRHLQDLTPFAVQFRYEEFTLSEANLDRLEVVRQVSDLIGHVEILIREAEGAG
jgi:HEPN domain-containing protein